MDTIRLTNGLITTDNYYFDFNTLDIFKIDETQKLKLTKEISKYTEVQYKPENIEFQVLKINTVNYCNLRCKYCYANEGTYNKEKKAITSQDIKLLDLLDPYMQNLKVITFFGGEPLLNPDVIEYICEKFKNRGITFLAQTNGTLFHKRNIDLIKKYDIKCTVIVDGNREKNDAFRVFKDGKGTFDIIYEGFKKVKDNIVSIEGTRADFSIDTNDLYEELYDLFHVDNIKIIDDQRQQNRSNDLLLDPESDFNNLFYKIQKETLASNLLLSFFAHQKSDFFVMQVIDQSI